MRSGCGPRAIKPVVLRTSGLNGFSLAGTPAGTPMGRRACCAAAARNHFGSKRPVGYVKRSFQNCSNRPRSAASVSGLLPGTGIYRAGRSASLLLKTPDPKSASNAPEKLKSRLINKRRLKNAEWVQEFFFIFLIQWSFGACSWGIKTLPRSPSSRGAVEMFCLVEPQGCRKTWFVDVWADLVKPFFGLRPLPFRSAAVRITRTIVFGAQLRSRPHQIAALTIPDSRITFPATAALRKRSSIKTRCGDESHSQLRKASRARALSAKCR